MRSPFPTVLFVVTLCQPSPAQTSIRYIQSGSPSRGPSMGSMLWILWMVTWRVGVPSSASTMANPDYVDRARMSGRSAWNLLGLFITFIVPF